MPLPTKKLDRRVRRSEVLRRYAMSAPTLRKAILSGVFPAYHRTPGSHLLYWWESDLIVYEQQYK